MIKTESGGELKKKLLSGINKLNDSVSSTLGPGGRNVILRGEDGEIRVTKDGVSVAKNFSKMEDPIEDIGVQMVKKVSEKSADKAGDGTTTSTLLATVMINEGMKVISQGSNAVEVKKGIDKAVKAVVNGLKDLSIDISSEDQIVQVATISANNDTEVGNLIATALDKVGNDGVVAIEESKTGETTLEVVEGMMFERGFKSHYSLPSGDDDLFIQQAAQNKNHAICIHTDAYCLSPAPIDWSSYIRQKSRHYSASEHYKVIKKALLGIYPFTLLLLLISFVLLCTNTEFHWVSSGVFFSVIMLKWWIIGRCLSKLNERRFAFTFLLWDIFFVVFTPLLYFTSERKDNKRW
jgi:hypothetical protein